MVRTWEQLEQVVITGPQQKLQGKGLGQGEVTEGGDRESAASWKRK